MKTYSYELMRWNKDGLESMYQRASYTGAGETAAFENYEHKFIKNEDGEDTTKIIKIRRHDLRYTH